MPSIATYTPYESLLFFQSVARHGADSAAFEDISNTLNANEFIRDGATYDTGRFTASALQGLYEELTTNEKDSNNAGAVGNATANGTNPRKRKLSASPDSYTENPSEHQNEGIVQALVDRLYVRYKEQVVREIKQDEEDYTRLQREIREIKERIQAEQQPLEDGVDHDTTTATELSDKDHQSGKDAGPSRKDAVPASSPSNPLAVNDSRSSPQTLESASRSSAAAESKSGVTSPALPSQSQQPGPRVDSPAEAHQLPFEQYANRPGQPPPPLQYTDHAGQHHSPSAFHNRTLPPPSPQRAHYGPINTQPTYPHGSPSNPMAMMPPVPGMPPMAPPDYSAQQRRPSSSQGRGSPLPYHQQPPYPAYSAYPPPPGPWQQPLPGQPPHQYQHSPYASPQFYVQPQPGRPPPHMQSPAPNMYQQYPHPTPPTQFKGQPIWQGPIGTPWNAQTASASSTPVARSIARNSAVRRSGSSTPWKRRPDPQGGPRPSSPHRPERDVSPLTDRDSPAPGPQEKEEGRSTRRTAGRGSRAAAVRQEDHTESRRDSRSTRRTRAGSTASSAIGPSSRSQSITSFTSDRQTGPARGRARKIKNEPPSTPAPFPSDSEPQKPSGRRGHGRHDTLTSHPAMATATSKRKRSSANYSSPTPSLPSPAFPPPLRRQQTSIDPSLISVSKTFAKTANLLISEITAHKVASTFSKPLTEGVAPGYKSLILRPQDLKSIKAAVSRGGRAVTAAIEEIESEHHAGGEGGETPTPTKANTGGYIVKKTEELVPPRGIVNSAQLELELMRMFANAVMFNPLRESERGLGHELQIMPGGGGRDESEMSEEAEGADAEDGGIISETREMCKDVIDSVTKFRGLEDDRMYGGAEEGAMKGSMATALRAASVSVSVHSGADEGASVLEEGEHAAVGNGRKRRRIAEN